MTLDQQNKMDRDSIDLLVNRVETGEVSPSKAGTEFAALMEARLAFIDADPESVWMMLHAAAL